MNIKKKSKSMCLLDQNSIPVHHFSVQTKIKMEKEILGIYVSTHPLSLYRKNTNCLLSPGYIKIKSYHIEQLKNNQKVAIAGLLVQVRRQFTKNNQVMAFLLLEDEISLFEGIAFPVTFNHYFNLLRKEALLLLEGKLSKQTGDEKIIIEKITDIGCPGQKKVSQHHTERDQ